MRRLAVLIWGVFALSVNFLPIQAQNESVHVVQPGETLYRIALRYDTSLLAIVDANNISNVNVVYVGQVLHIPHVPPPHNPQPNPPLPPIPQPPPAPDPLPTTYTVQAGDTLFRIAQRFGTTVQRLIEINGIANPNRLEVGQVIALAGTAPDPVPDPDPITDPDEPPIFTPVFELGGQVLQGDYPYSALMRQTGMTWAKRQIVWTRGTPASVYQDEIDRAQSLGFSILLGVVGDVDEYARTNPTQYNQEFATFLAGLARGGADAIEVWNEPNLAREWPAGRISGANYTAMLRTSYQAIKAANSATLVISAAPAPTGGLGCSTNGCNDDSFIRAMAGAGATQYMDCVGIHYNAGAVSPYARGGAPVASNAHYSWYYPAMVDLYTSVFPSRPLCFTELGYVSNEGFSPQLPATFSWASNTTVQDQALWLAQAVEIAENSGRVRMLIVWNVDAVAYTSEDPQAAYAIVRPDGTCPSCNTIAATLN
jgi:LysM repeat protein